MDLPNKDDHARETSAGDENRIEHLPDNSSETDAFLDELDALDAFFDLPLYASDDEDAANYDFEIENPVNDPTENPWIDVFGEGDEAETAYWNTD